MCETRISTYQDVSGRIGTFQYVSARISTNQHVFPWSCTQLTLGWSLICKRLAGGS
jgi:hypothetical protein